MQSSMSMSATSSSSEEETAAGKTIGIEAPPQAPQAPPKTAFGMMKDRATMARNTITPHMQQMKEKTSKRFQPSLDRVRSSASAAASIGANRMQPALSKVREGSTQGWSMIKTKVATVAPVAEKIQHMGMYAVNEYLGETPLEEVVVVESAALASCRFMEQYRHGMPDTSRLPRILLSRSRSGTASSTSSASSRSRSGTMTSTTSNRSRSGTIPNLMKSKSIDMGQLTPSSPAELCFATPYVVGNILLFCGSLETLASVSLVSKPCRSFIKSERRLWRFCVRYGDMREHVRFAYWEHCANVDKLRDTSELDFETYLLMAKSKGECTELILTDVRRTYGRVAPHKRAVSNEVLVDTEQELINQLSDILHALSGRFPDVGYCQGMDYIAAHVLDHVKKSSEASEAARLARKAQQAGMESPPTSPTRTSGQAASRLEVERAFWVLVALFEQYGLRQMFCPGLQQLQLHCFQTQRLFELLTPALSEHFENEKVLIDMFTVGWFQTLFLYLNVLPRETLDKLWDIFLFEKNWKMLVRTTLALLQLSEPHIVGQPIDQVMQFLNTFSTPSGENLLAPETLIPHALSIKVTNSMLTKLSKQHARRKKTGSR